MLSLFIGELCLILKAFAHPRESRVTGVKNEEPWYCQGPLFNIEADTVFKSRRVGRGPAGVTGRGTADVADYSSFAIFRPYTHITLNLMMRMGHLCFNIRANFYRLPNNKIHQLNDRSESYNFKRSKQ